MKHFIQLEQGSEQWFKIRQERIGASEAASILGTNPWESEQELVNRKLGLTTKKKMNADMKRGVDLEPIVRQMINEKHSTNYVPAVVENSNCQFAIASLDGWDENAPQKILEIKCPRSHPFQVPTYHLPQLQWQMMVGEEDSVLYVSFDGKTLNEHVVKRDQKMIDELTTKGKATWKKFN